ncbi:uncharacterized protein J8A68_000846 [[Candida] subhashii]|uniref:C2H2-type domain-containing protein n=1 Tax=[Candida] subhashii TaxID=561895 RepID=A0A8J5QTZ5_9ASCO|nr:uncharacterized protein J8A68_000846 [[Candida] subhashii]KAG7665640.1 hypothetical protein J8A68_000846 [[Candida] subhashii]
MEVITHSEYNQLQLDSTNMNNINNSFDPPQKSSSTSQRSTPTPPYSIQQQVGGQQPNQFVSTPREPIQNGAVQTSLSGHSSTIPTNHDNLKPVLQPSHSPYVPPIQPQQSVPQQSYSQAQYDSYTAYPIRSTYVPQSEVYQPTYQVHPDMSMQQNTVQPPPIVPTQHYNSGSMPIDNVAVAYPIEYAHYPDLTTMVNSNANIAVPLVEAQFVDHKVCSLCGKKITRDMSRHMRTHQAESRFTCVFPRSQCIHKSGKFNRPYDFKKHLLNRHFQFDNPTVKKLHNLSDKLDHWGTCPCGHRALGRHWLDFHVLTDDASNRCPYIEVP